MAFIVARGLVSPASALPCRPVGGGVGPSKLSGCRIHHKGQSKIYCMYAAVVVIGLYVVSHVSTRPRRPKSLA